MRIAVVLEQAFARVPGGSGRYSVELARAVAAQAGTGDTVTGWAAWHSDVSAARLPGVRGPRRLPVPGRLLPRLAERGAAPRVSGADVLHCPTPLMLPSAAPTVVAVHDAVPFTHPETLTPHGARWHRVMIERAARSAATITVLTEAVADELRSALPALEPERVVVLGAGASEAVTRQPSPSELAATRARYPLPSRYLLSVATLEPRKGLDVLIEALGLLGPAAPTLVLVGQPGWGGLDAEAAAARAGLAPGTVRLLGRVADADLAVLLRDARALVMPSRSEGFGLPVVEAMAVGTPVVISDAPALVEVAGGAALVSVAGDARSLAEAVEAVSGSDELAARLSADGLAQARRHTWDEVGRRAWELYRTLAGGVGEGR